jgi:NAD(P)H-flavin reductase
MIADETADPFVPRPCRVTRSVREAADTVTLDLEPLESEATAFLPGQFNMLYAFGVGEIAVSLSGDPDGDGRLVHTVRSVGAVSTAIADLQAGEPLGVRGPFGSGWPLAPAEGADVVLIAGGLGLAPLRPAIYRLIARRERYRRAVVLVGMRNPAEILYHTQLEQWRRASGLEVEVTVDRPDAAWHGHVGVVPSLIPSLGLDPSATVAMICGPQIMMRFTANALRDAGLAPDRIYLSLERNMKCAVGWCGHCQLGPNFVCKDGPVMRLDRIARLLAVKEI